MSGSRGMREVKTVAKARLVYLAVIACLLFAYFGALVSFVGLSLGMSDGDAG
jgi:hypothetical protein